MASRFAQTPSSSRSPGIGGVDRVGPGRHDDVRRRMAHAVDLDHARPGEPAGAAQEVDAVALQPALLPGVGVVGDHEVAPRQRRLDVDLRGGRGLARGVHRLARSQQGLRRDARPVRALAADQLSLDEGDPQTALGQGAGAVLTRRAAADHDHVVVDVMSAAPARLLADHVRRRTSRPVRVGLPGPRLVLAMRRGSTAQRLGEVGRRRERRRCCVDAPGEPRRDLLEQPAVAVGVAERGERAVAAVVRPTPVDASGAAAPPNRQAKPVSQWKTSVTSTPLLASSSRTAAMSETIRYVDWSDPGAADVRFGAELDGAPGARRRELDQPEVVAGGDVGVEPPAEARVELLRAVDVRDGDDDHLELHVHGEAPLHSEWTNPGIGAIIPATPLRSVPDL